MPERAVVVPDEDTHCGARVGFANRVNKAWFVTRDLRRTGLAGTRWYGTPDNYRHLKRSGVAPAPLDSIEVNAHPVFRNRLLVDLDYPDRLLEKLLGDQATGRRR